MRALDFDEVREVLPHRRLQQLVRGLERDLATAEKAPDWRKKGELLSANLHRVRKGQAKIELADWHADNEPIELELDFGHCRLSVAAPEEMPYSGTASLQGKRIATSYVASLRDFLDRNDVEAEIVYFSGAVEIAPKLGKADYICDLVSTGSTLAANHLVEVETVFESEAVIIQTQEPLTPEKQAWVDKILQRLDGVLQVRESKYIMLHAPRDALDRIAELLPGSEYPTVIPLDGNGEKVAVHAVCREYVFWETLENLKAAGASSLLVLPVEKMLA